MRKTLLTTLLAFVAVVSAWGEDVKVAAQSGGLTATLKTGASMSLTIENYGHRVFTFDDIALTANGKSCSKQGKVSKVTRNTVAETLRPVVPLKQAEIKNRYNEATVTFRDGSALVVRVMDNAVAYRWLLPKTKNATTKVDGEQVVMRPADGFVAHYQTCGSFNTSYEEPYQHKPLAEWQTSGHLATLPALFSAADDSDQQVLVGESDVNDYPHMFLRGEAEGVKATFPSYPEQWEPAGDRSEKITKEGDYIALHKGQQLPWRWAVVTNSCGLIEQTVPVQLARRSVLGDMSWIKPGQVSWEWWNGAAPYGPDVNFKAGCNYETYCYFADFAAHYGIRYILLDEGWAKSTRDPFHGNDDLRLPDLIKYCDSIGVKIILWLPWLAVEQNFDTLFKTYAEWGITAVKIDFMDHADQWMNDFYRRVVAEAAKYKIIVDFHGAFTPSGLEYEYPNLISYEGVRGLEQMGGCVPENTTFLPFIRNAVGAADFTPSGMLNMQPERYRSERPNSAAMGTRCFQMALYVVLESGLQMLADNPTRYYQNDDCTRYIASVPTTWDETRCLAAKAGEYVVVAKRKGEQWFIGGITNGEPRDLTLKLDFLDMGKHQLTAYSDGVSADYQAMHYNKKVSDVNNTSYVNIHMARNGGWAGVVTPFLTKEMKRQMAASGSKGPLRLVEGPGPIRPIDSEQVFEIVEQMPSFPGGFVAMKDFLESNLKYPDEECVSGRTIVSFIVEKDGSRSNVCVTKALSPLCDKEAVRLIKSMPRWVPGKQNGHLVRVHYNVPVSFRAK